MGGGPDESAASRSCDDAGWPLPSGPRARGTPQHASAGRRHGANVADASRERGRAAGRVEGQRTGINRVRRLAVLLAGSVCSVWSASAVADAPPHDERSASPAFDVGPYGRRLEQFLSSNVLPKLSKAVVASAETRPRGLRIELAYDASPYRSTASVKDGELLVTLSLGYMLVHDAALDGAGISAVLKQPEIFERYLGYLISASRDRERRRPSDDGARRLATYAEFASLPPAVVSATFSDPQWHAQRRAAQEASLGWVIAHLLVSADPSLVPGHEDPGTAAARLTAAAGWFPVPPLATALGWAEYRGGALRSGEKPDLWCSAEALMNQGLRTARATSSWRPDDAPTAESRLAAVESQIARIRQRHRCGSAAHSKGNVSA